VKGQPFRIGPVIQDRVSPDFWTGLQPRFKFKFTLTINSWRGPIRVKQIWSYSNRRHDGFKIAP